MAECPPQQLPNECKPNERGEEQRTLLWGNRFEGKNCDFVVSQIWNVLVVP